MRKFQRTSTVFAIIFPALTSKKTAVNLDGHALTFQADDWENLWEDVSTITPLDELGL